MKISGHTLGTPSLDLPDALRLFRRLGMDGAEVIWQDDYRSGLPETDDEVRLSETRTIARELDLEIAALTPYVTGLNSLDDAERERDLERFARAIRAAERLDCRRIRVYAGRFFEEDMPRREAMWSRLIDSLQHLGAQATGAGVVLCVENHFGTMTVTAAETAALMAAVDSSGVGILYDQANLAFTYAESYELAIELQRRWIQHVHVKDLVFTKPDAPFVASDVARVSPEQRHVRSRLVGEGILDWPAIIAALRREGYDGYLSLEYEYRWHPQDLPDPEDGFRRGAERLRTMLGRAGVGVE